MVHYYTRLVPLSFDLTTSSGAYERHDVESGSHAYNNYDQETAIDGSVTPPPHPPPPPPPPPHCFLLRAVFLNYLRLCFFGVLFR